MVEKCEKAVEKTVESKIWGHCDQKRHKEKFMSKLDFSMKIGFESKVILVFINLIKICFIDAS